MIFFKLVLSNGMRRLVVSTLCKVRVYNGMTNKQTNERNEALLGLCLLLL